ncbi:MAG: alcohol dehydrogenase catalytic domain-containing protein [Anaerolineae bacterium]
MITHPFDPPDTMWAWPLFGAGLENLGQNGRPVRWPTPRPMPDQILVRSDAVGLCYSDVKILRQGGTHPRLYGRDLARHPIVQGHEVALTVVEVGEAWRDRFQPGQRLALQADIYYRGKNLAYGYVFMGGLAQYSLLGPAILAGDEGCYAIPVPDGLGYAEVALTEPWACVEAAYAPRRRTHVKAGGTLWLLGRPGLEKPYRLGTAFAGGPPARVIVTDAAEALHRELHALGVPHAVRNNIGPAEYAALAKAETAAGFDDIIILAPDVQRVEAAGQAIAPGGVIALIGDEPLTGPVAVDVGRIHYDYVVYLGHSGIEIAAAYGTACNRSELKPGGTAWIVGGGGPMGRMHLQRMLEMPAGPARILVTETNPVRNADLSASFAAPAQAKGVMLTVVNPKRMPEEELAATLQAIHGGHGFDDIVVIVASVPAIEAAMPHLACDGMLVVFGGLARGTMARLDLSQVYLGCARITGSAGSTIRDQATVLGKVAAGQLSTAGAVAAIGGMDAAYQGMQALMDGRFPGKIVIYPPVERFPLTALGDLKQIAPAVYGLLGPDGGWTRAAEAEFLQRYAA